jgi:DNA-binding FadR family transcriptional regulator
MAQVCCALLLSHRMALADTQRSDPEERHITSRKAFAIAFPSHNMNLECYHSPVQTQKEFAIQKFASAQAGSESERADGSGRQPKLYLKVVEAVALQIIGPGAGNLLAFPPEPELCRILNVSRTALREAVKVLEAKGLVEVTHGRGMRSRPRKYWNHLDSDVLKWQTEAGTDEAFARNLWELREIIEPAAAGLAAHRANESDIEALKDCYAKMEKGIKNPEAYLQADLEFHDAIFESCGNEVLSRMAQSTRGAFQVARHVSIRVPGWTYSLPLHRALLEAIAQRDAAGARAANLLIIRSGARDMLKVLASKGTPDSSNRPR